MTAAVLLDTGPLGVLTNPRQTPAVRAANRWLADLRLAGRRVIVPEISDYELRRELLLNGSRNALSRLAWLHTQLDYLPLASAAMWLAAEPWADARRRGFATAPPDALDADVILAAQAEALAGPTVVATANVGHLSRFTAAEFWLSITP